MSQEILELTPAEQEWVELRLEDIRSAIKKFGFEQNAPITPAVLDSAFTVWLSQHNPEQEDSNPYINAFGVGFGQYLADNLHLKWVLVRDEHGIEIALHGDPGDILIFPPNLVAKRYIKRETPFFVFIYTEMEKKIVTLRRSYSDKPNKNFWNRWKFWHRD